MSKRNSDGEVLFNKTAVGLAQQQQKLAALFGGSTVPAPAESHDKQPVAQTDYADLTGGVGDDEQFGVGAIIPKEVQDGSFTNRIPTSYEKLLENIVGKKAAKAHLASRQKTSPAVGPQKATKPTPTEESDEEEGRAATFKSKRQRRSRPVPSRREEESGDEDEESRAAASSSKKQRTTDVPPDEGNEGNEGMTSARGHGDESNSEVDVSRKVAPSPRQLKAKPKTYLDEILGEKAKKKKKMKKKKEKTGDSAKTDE